MGNVLTALQKPIGSAAGSVTKIITGRKRKRDDEDYDSGDDVTSALEQSMTTPKRYMCANLLNLSMYKLVVDFFLR